MNLDLKYIEFVILLREKEYPYLVWVEEAYHLNKYTGKYMGELTIKEKEYLEDNYLKDLQYIYRYGKQQWLYARDIQPKDLKPYIIERGRR